MIVLKVAASGEGYISYRCVYLPQELRGQGVIQSITIDSKKWVIMSSLHPAIEVYGDAVKIFLAGSDPSRDHLTFRIPISINDSFLKAMARMEEVIITNSACALLHVYAPIAGMYSCLELNKIRKFATTIGEQAE